MLAAPEFNGEQKQRIKGDRESERWAEVCHLTNQGEGFKWQWSKVPHAAEK